MKRHALALSAAAVVLSMGAPAAMGQDGAGGPVTEGSARDLELQGDQSLKSSTRRARQEHRASALADPDHPDDHDHGQHGTPIGHLPPSQEHIALVGRLDLTDQADRIADVAGDPRPGFAYLTGRGVGADCAEGGAIHVADIRNARHPKEAARIKFPTNRFPGEGIHAIRLKTRFFDGVVAGANNEVCSGLPADLDGGLSLYDVTKPTRPRALAENFGDKETRGTENAVIHDYQSIFLWQAGDRAFAMGTDNDEQGGYDVDIFEITDPRNPVLISETGRPDWPVTPDVQRAHGQQPLNHDFQVLNIRGTWIANVAYWDAGYVILNVDDPANPVFVNNTDWTNPDPIFPSFTTPEGNAHQVWYDRTKRYFIGTDEDFSPYRTDFRVTTGPATGDYESGEFGWTVPINSRSDGTLNGPVTYGGYGCPNSGETIPPPPTGLEPGEEAILVLQRGPVNDPNAPFPACLFSLKVEAGQNAGYDAVIIANHHSAAGGGASPDASTCGSQGHQFTPTVHAVCVGHRALHLLFNREPDYTLPYPSGDPGDKEPNIGDLGEKVSITTAFDGWGYPHLYDAGTLEEIDTYAIPEAADPRYAEGFGHLSVHEVQFEQTRDLAWFSWYSGGVRVAKYGRNGITEVGHYIAEDGSDFWGIDFGRDRAGRRYALASDRDDGLWIFRYAPHRHGSHHHEP